MTQKIIEIMESNLDFDVSRARLGKADMFQRFRVPTKGFPLKKTNLHHDEYLLIVERQEKKRALLARQMAYHHLAQGILSDEHYIVTFCTVCHSGMSFSPIIDSNLYHFSAGGLYDGIVLLIDDETKSYWNHITGVAVYGPLKGKIMKAFPLEITTVQTCQESNEDIEVSLSQPGIKGRVMGRLTRNNFFNKGFLPPGFRKTMGKIDDRLPEMTNGLGVIGKKIVRFYPVKEIKSLIHDEFEGKNLQITIDPATRIPIGTWLDNDFQTKPLQLFSRWYGFVYTYPNCEIFTSNIQSNNNDR